MQKKNIYIFFPCSTEKKLLRLFLLSIQATNTISQQYLRCSVFYWDKFLLVEARAVFITNWAA